MYANKTLGRGVMKQKELRQRDAKESKTDRPSKRTQHALSMKKPLSLKKYRAQDFAEPCTPEQEITVQAAIPKKRHLKGCRCSLCGVRGESASHKAQQNPAATHAALPTTQRESFEDPNLHDISAELPSPHPHAASMAQAHKEDLGREVNHMGQNRNRAGNLAQSGGAERVDTEKEALPEQRILEPSHAQHLNAAASATELPAEVEALPQSKHPSILDQSDEMRVLIAMPRLQDGYFDQSVILLAEFNHSAAMGFVVSAPSTTTVADLMYELDIQPRPEHHEQPILVGGPVQNDFCWVLHTPEFEGVSTVRLSAQICLSGAQEVLPALAANEGPQFYWLGVGYAGWGSSQLEQEIEAESWWLARMDPLALIRESTELRWRKALRTLGLNQYSLFRVANS